MVNTFVLTHRFVEFVLTLDQFSLNLLSFHQFLLSFQLFLPSFHQYLSSFHQSLFSFHQFSFSFHQFSLCFHQILLSFHQSLLDFELIIIFIGSEMAAQAGRNQIDLDQGNAEGLELLRKSLKSVRSTEESTNASHVFVVFGASGDLAKKKIYPTLWSVFKENLFPKGTRIVGYARSKLTVEDIRQKCQPWIKVSDILGYLRKSQHLI